MKKIERQLLYLITIAGSAKTSDLITVLSTIGTTESYVRINLANLKRDNYIEQPKRGTYQGSEMAITYINELTNKFERNRKKGDTSFTLVTTQFTDANRQTRNHVRQYLNKIGFGQMQNGIYIAPYNRLADIEYLVSEYKLDENMQAYLVGETYPRITPAVADDVWNLTEVNQEIKKIQKWQEEFLIPKVQNATTNLELLACYLELIDAVSEIYVLDPMLPENLLNSAWVGTQTLIDLVKTGITIVSKVDSKKEFTQFFDYSILKYKK